MKEKLEKEITEKGPNSREKTTNWTVNWNSQKRRLKRRKENTGRKLKNQRRSQILS